MKEYSAFPKAPALLEPHRLRSYQGHNSRWEVLLLREAVGMNTPPPARMVRCIYIYVCVCVYVCVFVSWLQMLVYICLYRGHSVWEGSYFACGCFIGPSPIEIFSFPSLSRPSSKYKMHIPNTHYGRYIGIYTPTPIANSQQYIYIYIYIYIWIEELIY